MDTEGDTPNEYHVLSYFGARSLEIPVAISMPSPHMRIGTPSFESAMPVWDTMLQPV